MDEYIDRHKAIEAIEDLHDCYNGFSDTYDKACIIGVIEEIASADVEPVVRCKACVVQRICRFAQWLGLDGYCSQGARMDGCEQDE